MLPITIRKVASGVALVLSGAAGVVAAAADFARRDHAAPSIQPGDSAAPRAQVPIAPGNESSMPMARTLFPGVGLVESFPLEQRDEQWASSMERTLGARFSAAPFDVLNMPDARFGAVECHASTCRVTLRYPAAYDERPPPMWLPPKRRSVLHAYIWSSGRLAEASDGQKSIAADGYVHHDIVLGFGPLTHEPMAYETWVVESRRQIQLQVAQLRAHQ